MSTPHAPGKAHRTGLSIIQLMDMFPNEGAARDWFEAMRWPDDVTCPRCKSDRVSASSGSMSHWCAVCRRRFSVRTGTVMERSRIPLRKWAIAIYMVVTNLKGVSSMKLHRELNVTQKTAWFLLHRIREAMEASADLPLFVGPVEVDEMYVGGIESKKHASKRLRKGRGPVGKTTVMGVKDRATGGVRAEVVRQADSETVLAFLDKHVSEHATIFTDGEKIYSVLGSLGVDHESVKHSHGEYVRGEVWTNGMESFWAMFKRGFQGVYHRMSAKHLQAYVDEFASRHRMRDDDTLEQMTHVVAGMVGKRLTYDDLIA